MRGRVIVSAFVLVVFGCDKSSGGGAASSSAKPGASSAAAANSAGPADSGAAASAAPPPSATPAAAGKSTADASRLQLDGKPIQGGLIRAKLGGKLKRMEFPGHRAIVSDDGTFLIAFGRDAPEKEKITITFDDGSVLEHDFDVEQRTYETDKVNGLSEDLVNLDGPTRVKLEQVEKRIEAIRKKYGKKACYDSGFIMPVKGKITSRYGQPRVLNGTDGGIHWGVDIAAPIGTAVHAPACGTVVFAETDVPLSGTTVIIDHGHGLTSAFLHLMKFNVKVDDEVKQGQVIGNVGNTGRTNGPHLDWRANFFETRIDAELLPSLGKK